MQRTATPLTSVRFRSQPPDYGNFNIMRILITGVAGFIGFHLAKKLIEQRHEVVGIDNINDYYDKNLKYARLTEHGIKSDKIKKNVIIKSNKFFNYSFIKADIADHDFIVDFMIEKKFKIKLKSF